MVAAARYSSALARKPSGGAGSSMRSMSRPLLGHRVDVLRQRAVHERQHARPGASSSMRHVDGEVRADAPVLLFEDVVDHPAAVRRLQQRVVEEEHEAAAGREHAADLRDRRAVVGQVLEHEARDRGVERRVGERQLLGARRGRTRARRRARPRP